MTVYEAIEQMRRLSEKGESFSLSFMSYSLERKKSEGVVAIEHAKLLKQTRADKNRYADYMLNLMNLDTLERASCWQMLLMEFNGHELELQ